MAQGVIGGLTLELGRKDGIEGRKNFSVEEEKTKERDLIQNLKTRYDGRRIRGEEGGGGKVVAGGDEKLEAHLPPEKKSPEQKVIKESSYATVR